MTALGFLALAVGLFGFVGVSAGKVVRGWCSERPGYRPVVVILAAITLVAVGLRIPGIGDLEPPWSESPSGIFLIIGRFFVYGSLAATALGALVGAVMKPPSYGASSRTD